MPVYVQQEPSRASFDSLIARAGGVGSAARLAGLKPRELSDLQRSGKNIPTEVIFRIKKGLKLPHATGASLDVVLDSGDHVAAEVCFDAIPRVSVGELDRLTHLDLADLDARLRDATGAQGPLEALLDAGEIARLSRSRRRGVDDGLARVLRELAGLIDWFTAKIASDTGLAATIDEMMRKGSGCVEVRRKRPEAPREEGGAKPNRGGLKGTLSPTVRAALAAWGLPETAKRSDVEQRFRKLAVEAHPDRGGTTDAFLKLMQEREELMARWQPRDDEDLSAGHPSQW